MNSKCSITSILLFLAVLIPVSAQRKADIENGKDYPLISRFEDSVIEFYKVTQWGTYMLPVSDEGTIDWAGPMALSGKVIRIQYSASADNNSEFILHNYKTAFEQAGFEVLIAIADKELGVSDRPHTWFDKYYASGGYYGGLNNEKFGMSIHPPMWNNNHCFIAARGRNQEKDIYAAVYAIVDEDYTLIIQDIIEVESAQAGLVSVDSITDNISADGHVAIYDIRFAPDKADLLPESSEALTNIAEFLNANPDRKFFVVGHAAGTGVFLVEMSLSMDRAQAVVEELVANYGVDEDQLFSWGVGALCPVASNKTEEGRALNRRVELVEQ